MREADRFEFTGLMRKLCAVHGRQPTNDVIAAYFEGCGTLTLEAFRSAISTAIAESRDWPTPAELRAMAPTPIERPSYPDETQTYRCPHCLDTGLLLEEIMLERVNADPYPVGRTARPCNCPAGDAIAERWSKPMPKSSALNLRDVGRANSVLLERWRRDVRDTNWPARSVAVKEQVHAKPRRPDPEAMRPVTQGQSTKTVAAPSPVRTSPPPKPIEREPDPPPVEYGE